MGNVLTSRIWRKTTRSDVVPCVTLLSHTTMAMRCVTEGVREM